MKGTNDPIFNLDSREQWLLSLAYIQMLVVKAVLYFATQNGKRGFTPVPAMIAALIVRAAYEHANGVEAKFLPHNHLVGMQYPRDIFMEGFWWDGETINAAHKEMLAIADFPESMRVVAMTLITENSVLHPNGLIGMQISSWWIARPCGPQRDNLHIRLTEENKAEVRCGLMRLGSKEATWCARIGRAMSGYNDWSLPQSRCSECHPTL